MYRGDEAVFSLENSKPNFKQSPRAPNCPFRRNSLYSFVRTIRKLKAYKPPDETHKPAVTLTRTARSTAC